MFPKYQKDLLKLFLFNRTSKSKNFKVCKLALKSNSDLKLWQGLRNLRLEGKKIIFI